LKKETVDVQFPFFCAIPFLLRDTFSTRAHGKIPHKIPYFEVDKSGKMQENR
jgi:hypothetical protein